MTTPATEPDSPSAEPPPTPDPPKIPFAWLTPARAVIGIAVATLAFVIAMAIEGAGSDEPTDSGASQVCRDFVRDRLVSPASADFSNLRSNGSGKVWTVTGTVDSDNLFGASIRNTFTCRVEYLGDSRWDLVSLTGLRN